MWNSLKPSEKCSDDLALMDINLQVIRDILE